MNAPPLPPLRPEVRSALRRLRWRIRGYGLLYGLLTLLSVAGAVFWVWLALDYLPVWLGHDEPDRPTRVVLLIGFSTLGAAVAYWGLVRRVLVRLPDRAMAMLLERRFGQFQDALLTSVELAQNPRHAQAFHRQLLAHTFHQAAEKVAQVELGAVFRWRPLARAALVALVAGGSVGGFAWAAPQAFELWVRRALLLQDVLWPRLHHIQVQGPRRRKVARGDDVTILVRADARKRIPRTVRLEYQFLEDGLRGSENMIREGTPRQGFQLFTYTFRDLTQSLRFDAVGGDHRVRDYWILVVDSPSAELKIHCVYPAYMQDPQHQRYTPRTLPVSGVMELPQGTQVTVLGRSTKPLREVWAVFSGEEKSFSKRRQQVQLTSARAFQLELPPLNQDLSVEFELLDTDGIRNKQPIRLALVAVPDQPPEVDIRLVGIGTAVTPQVRIPLRGEVRDDYGIKQVQWLYQVDQGPEVRVPLVAEAQRRTQIQWHQDPLPALDFRQLVQQALKQLRQKEASPDRQKIQQALAPYQLQPGQKLVLTVVASDACTLGSGPQEGQGQRFLLDVVSPEELRAILAAQELNLRKRLEQILEEIRQTQDALNQLPAEWDKQKDLALLRVQRARQNSEKNANEVLGVALGFEDIRQQFLNNRMDNPEVDRRLAQQIAQPLRQVAQELFPELDLRLQQLQQALEQSSNPEQLLSPCQEQIAQIILRLEEVLQNMLELETFEEAIQLVREIIEEQKQLREKTKQYRIRRLTRPKSNR